MAAQRHGVPCRASREGVELLLNGIFLTRKKLDFSLKLEALMANDPAVLLGDLTFARGVVDTIPDHQLADEVAYWRGSIDPRRWAFLQALHDALRARELPVVPTWRR